MAHHVRHRLTQNPGEQLRVHASHRERTLALGQFGANTGGLQGTPCALNLTREVGHAQARHGRADLRQGCAGQLRDRLHFGTGAGGVNLQQALRQLSFEGDDGQGVAQHVVHVAGNLLAFLGESQRGTCHVRAFAQLNQVGEAQKTQQRRADKESNASVRGEIETAHSNECQPADCAHRRRDGQSQTVRGNRAKNPERHKVHAEAQQNYVYVTRGQHRHTYQRQNHQCRPDDASAHRGGDRHQPRHRVRRAVHHREHRN